MKPTNLVDEFELYSAWRDAVTMRVEALRDWLDAQELNDADSARRLNQLLGRLSEDTLNVAFVAEFSRGKSELINAIFFSDYQQRVLPSSAGRTTMCPTELYYNPTHRPSLRLLPIDTKTRPGSIADFKNNADAWAEFPLNLDSADEMSATLIRLADTMQVDAATAESYGLINPNDADTAHTLERDGSIAIPRWRHALISIDHPLLRQGLRILDTPGLNALGAEPELTLSLLPHAQAVLFLIGADTGVTANLLLAQACNNRWSNHRLLAACALLPVAALRAPQPAAFFGSLWALLGHLLELTEQIAETDHFAVWKSAEESGTYYHIELGQVSLHLDSEEWDELVTLIKSVA